MAGGDPRSHHAVPECLSKHFAGEDGTLFAVKTSGGDPFSTTPKKLFKYRDLYAAVRSDGSRDTTLETEYSKIENRAAPVIARLIEVARDRSRSLIVEGGDKLAIDHFVYAQFTRTPEFDKKYEYSDQFEEKLREIVSRGLADGSLTPDHADALFDPAAKEILKQNSRVNALGRPGPQTNAAMAALSLEVLCLRDTTSQFCLGSWPIVSFQGRPFDGSDTWASQSWLPIAPDVAIRYRMPGGKIFFSSASDGDSVVRFNRMTWRQSSFVASRSRELLTKLIDEMKQTNSVGTNE